MRNDFNDTSKSPENEADEIIVGSPEAAQTVEQAVESGTISLSEAVDLIRNSPEFEYDPKYQFQQNGRLMQMVAKIRPHKHGRLVAVSIVVDHTPKSKYTGERLRKLRKEKGIGRPIV